MEKATFAAGCFWGVEAAFRRIRGVTATSVGYIGGTMENPSYEMVCTGQTGHAEAVQVEFEPDQVTYVDLLCVFWDSHNPTTLNRQGPDAGTQYRSAIFCHDAEQKSAAETSKQENQARFGNKIVTEITNAPAYYKAEEYHQQYFEKNQRGLRRFF